MVIVGRHINGITLNPLEWLLDDKGNEKTFESEEQARKFLLDEGMTEEELYYLVFEEVDAVARNYKSVKNGRGTTLEISPLQYISVGKDGMDVTIRGNGKVIAFDSWDDFVNAVDEKKAAYHVHDENHNASDA